MRPRLFCGFLLSALVLFGCENAEWGARETGAVTGGAIGAGLGAIIGHETGDPGAGVAIGAGIGALSGGLIGNEIQNQQDDIDETQKRIDDNDRTIQENRRILDELKQRGADVRTTSRGVVVNLPDVLFEFDSARLRRDAIDSTRQIASVINEFPDRHVAVEGHTDSVGTIQYNQRLSEERARSVADELVSEGISRRRMSTRGFGESDPIASNRTESGRSRNRRVEVIIENN